MTEHAIEVSKEQLTAALDIALQAVLKRMKPGEPFAAGTLKATRYSCMDDFKTSVEVTLPYYIRKAHGDELYLTLIGGPTGYESMQPFTDRARRGFEEGKPWAACFGTKGRWDKLDVSAEEMLRVIESHKRLWE